MLFQLRLGWNPLGVAFPLGGLQWVLNREKMSVRAAAYCSSGMVTGSLATCHLWSRTFDSSRGLSLHLRKGDTEHQEFYHSQGARTIEENTAKRRWDKEELYLITKMELELITKGRKTFQKDCITPFPTAPTRLSEAYLLKMKNTKIVLHL